MSVASKLRKLESMFGVKESGRCLRCREEILFLTPETGYLPDDPKPGYPRFAGNDIFDRSGHCRCCGARPWWLVRITDLGPKIEWEHGKSEITA